jgi:hypothetical protein
MGPAALVRLCKGSTIPGRSDPLLWLTCNKLEVQIVWNEGQSACGHNPDIWESLIIFNVGPNQNLPQCQQVLQHLFSVKLSSSTVFSFNLTSIYKPLCSEFNRCSSALVLWYLDYWDSTLHVSCLFLTKIGFNPLNAKISPICHVLALLGAHHILHISRIRVNVHVL